MIRRAPLSVVMMLLPSLAMAQSTAPTHFDVIVVKPAPPENRRMSLQWSSTDWETRNLPLRVLIAFASNVQPWLVSGLPAWAENTRWDIDAKVTDADATLLETLPLEDRRALMISTLQDRFGMKSHQEQKIQPVFEMTVQSGGPKFAHTPPLPPGTAEPKFGRTRWTLENGVLQGTSITMQQLAEQLSGSLNRDVVNKTELSGAFDFRLQLPSKELSVDTDNGSDDGSPTSLFDAVKQQLGLKLSAGKAPVPTIVVDSIHQPEAN